MDLTSQYPPINGRIHEIQYYILTFFAKKGDLKVVKHLIEQGADPQVALLFSVEHGHLELVKYLLAQGININTLNENILVLAAYSKNLELLKYLISIGADIHQGNELALRWAACEEWGEIVDILLDEGANIDVAIKYCQSEDTENILKKYIKRELYIGPINDKTEMECGICLTAMEVAEELYQCGTCKKCTHKRCMDTWSHACIFCRN